MELILLEGTSEMTSKSPGARRESWPRLSLPALGRH